MMPFFSYYGGKWRVATHYPKPAFKNIVEPFAGSAGFSVRYYWHQVTLYDVDPIICGLWEYLVKVSRVEIESLPLKVVNVDDLAIPQEARWLIGFWINKASATSHKSPSSWMLSGVRPDSHWGSVIRSRIARQVEKIRHWKIVNASYETIENCKASWFVDPPYRGPPGRHYRFKVEDYAALAEWCKSREGQVTVCERRGASWLPFEPFKKTKAMGGPKGSVHSDEVIWAHGERGLLWE